MKILVTVKRVEDPEISIKINGEGTWIDPANMKYVVNPFDEIAVEEALRLRDANEGEVVVASIGVNDAVQQIRTALAMGADRGVHVVTEPGQYLDSMMAAKLLAKVAEEEKPDLILLGKQAVDDDMGQVGILLAELLGWSQASFASKEESLESEDEKAKKPALAASEGKLEVVREVDGGLETLALSLPAVVTTELRLNLPRYASLPGIMKAKKKEVREHKVDELVPGLAPRLKVVSLEAPPARQAGVIVDDVASLVDKLRNEAKVL